LNLFRTDQGTQLMPNYYAYVQPEIEQRDAAERQQIQSERAQRRNKPSASQPSSDSRRPAPSPTGVNTAAHYMDTAQFYSAWR
jgi:hypothetical protein